MSEEYREFDVTDYVKSEKDVQGFSGRLWVRTRGMRP